MSIVGVLARPGPGGLAPGQLGDDEEWALHGTPTNENILSILAEGLKASDKVVQWSGTGVYFSSKFGLSGSYNHECHQVIICPAIKVGRYPYDADDLTLRRHEFHTFDPSDDGVDCRVPGGVQSLGFANEAGDRFTCIRMGSGSIVKGKRRHSQIALPPDEAGKVAARADALIIYKRKSTDLYTGPKFTPAEIASHPTRREHAAATEAKWKLAQGGSGPLSGVKRPRIEDHLPSNSGSTTPNTSRGHKLSDSKNPALPARDAARQHWTSKGTDSDRCIVLSDSDNDDDAAEIGRSVQTQAPMGASQSQVRRPVLLACNAPATLSARAVSMRSSVCAGDRAARAGVPVAACVDDHRGAL
jgi:hypothetical protein